MSTAVDLKDKVAIVTGSSMGIGKSIAAELLRRGAKVVLNGRNEQRLRQTQIDFEKEGFPTIAFAADISDPEDCHDLVQGTMEAFGRIDMLVNNAGISMEGEVDCLSPEVFQKTFAVNTVGTALMTQAALPCLRQTGGSVIFISSLAALYGLPRFSAYCASKMALTSFAQALSLEVSQSGVHVGIAYLGFTENDPHKSILGPDGKAMPQPHRNVFKAQPAAQVAADIVQMIERRQTRRVFSNLGHLTAFVARFAPWLAKWQVQRMYRNYLISLQPEIRINERGGDAHERQTRPHGRTHSGPTKPQSA